MYKQSFGSIGQMQFANEQEYYRLLGYLAKSNGSTELVWERNEEQGAWESEGRIKFLSPKPNNIGILKLTAGVGKILYRVNCNEFVKNMMDAIKEVNTGDNDTKLMLKAIQIITLYKRNEP